MQLQIFTPSKKMLDQTVVSVTLPAEKGEITVLDGHDILITTLKAGRAYCRYTDSSGKSKKKDFEIDWGLAEITKDTARLFVESSRQVVG